MPDLLIFALGIFAGLWLATLGFTFERATKPIRNAWKSIKEKLFDK
jgi:hypothetical protein